MGGVPGAHSVHWRLTVSMLFGAFVALVCQGRAQVSWPLTAATAVFAVSVGISTLWSP